jgi:hypothetical protein
MIDLTFYNENKMDVDEYIRILLKNKPVNEIVETYIYSHCGGFTRDHVTRHINIATATVEELLSNKIAYCTILKFLLQHEIIQTEGCEDFVKQKDGQIELSDSFNNTLIQI